MYGSWQLLMHTNEEWSRILFDFARVSSRRRDIAVFCASALIWLMAGFGIGRTYPHMLSLMSIILLPWGASLFLSDWIKRPRPFHPEHYKPLIHLLIETPSFPSSHATIAFALVVAFIHDVTVWPFMLVGAVLVAIGRMAVGVHYLSDVVVGALIGFGLGYAIRVIVM